MSKESSEAYEKLKFDWNPVLLKISKSYKSGFTQNLAITHTNTLLLAVNKYLKEARSLPLVTAVREWEIIRATLQQACKRLVVEIEIPQNLPPSEFKLLNVSNSV